MKRLIRKIRSHICGAQRTISLGRFTEINYGELTQSAVDEQFALSSKFNIICEMQIVRKNKGNLMPQETEEVS